MYSQWPRIQATIMAKSMIKCAPRVIIDIEGVRKFSAFRGVFSKAHHNDRIRVFSNPFL
jgi:hypothetical protein